MKSKCKTCGNNTDSGQYCFLHKPRTPLKGRAKLKQTKPLGKGIWHQMRECNVTNYNELTREKIIDVVQEIFMPHFFMNIWKKRSRKSEVSGTKLPKEPSSAYFHHILAKSKYPEAAYDEENIIILTIDEHNNVENNMYKYEEINKRREYLKKKYNIV